MLKLGRSMGDMCPRRFGIKFHVMQFDRATARSIHRRLEARVSFQFTLTHAVLSFMFIGDH